MSKTNKKHDGILNNAVKINLNHFDKTHFLDNWILIITNYARGFLFFLLTIVKLLTVGFGFFLLSILISGVYVGFNKTLVDVQALHCKGYLFDLLNTLPIQLLSDHRDFVVYGDIEQLEIQFPYEMRILNDVKAIYYARDEYTAYYKVKTPILLGASNTKIINKGKVVSVLTHMLGNKVANIYNYDVGSYESLAAFPIIKGNSKFPNDRLINENDINYKYNLKTGIKICENIEHLVRFIIKEGFSEKMMKYFEDRIDKLSMMLTDLLKVLGSDVPGIDPPNESQIIKLANVLPALTIFISIVGYLSITMMMRAFENDDRILVIGWFFLYAVSAILTIVLSTALLKFTSFISITISFTLLLVSCFRYMVHHDYETQKERMDRINHFKKNSTPSDIPSTKRLLYFVVFFSLLASYYSFPVISDLPVFFLNAIKIFINRIASSNFTIVASNKIKYILPYESFEYMTSGYVNFLKYLSEHLPIQDYIGSITYDSIQNWKAYFFLWI